jgi:alginate O-acetyltransferase complex protein AlgI
MHARPGARKALLVTTVLADLSVLAVWKYAGFAAEQAQAVSELLDGPAVPAVQLALPIGISFFTFHHISYIVDVYRHSRHAQKSPVQFATYIAMFPQLVAGPIVRYHEIDKQLPETDRDKLDDFAAGFPRFALGLTKKVVIADALSPVADAVFALPEDQLTTPVVWLGVLAYTLQIYFDFSGYSDMAIGLGPHDRLPPAGELRAALLRGVGDRLLAALAHVAVALVPRLRLHPARRQPRLVAADLPQPVHRLLPDRHLARRGLDLRRLGACSTACCSPSSGRPGWPGWPTTPGSGRAGRSPFLLVVVGWVFFRAADMGRALEMLRLMFVPRFGEVPAEVTTVLTDQRTLVFVLGMLVVLMPRDLVMGKVVDESRTRIAGAARVAYSAVGAPYAAVLVAAGTFSPFLYFQF